ncbi:MAG: helix-turn-helix domain-containing protein [Clostridia bacterium]|nr:helix-turn-helix domain-containing protein [Clostridia bacterium]
MDKDYYTTDFEKRKRGKHLTAEDRGQIRAFKKLGMSNRAIAKEINCSPFAHPYSSWERPQNERSNGLLRRFIPKGHSINEYTAEEILQFADEINAKPRRKLKYFAPEELFDAFLDTVYSVR